MEKYGFVYLWRDRKHKRYYVGCHWGSETDGYICSSKWMRSSYRRRPQDFKRRVITRVYNKKEMFETEHRWLQMIKLEEMKTRYYNLSLNRYAMYDFSEDDWQNRSFKISFAKVGRVFTTEHRRKLSNAAKGRVVKSETRMKISKSNLGKILSEETKAKISRSHLGHTYGMAGKKHDEATIKKMIDANIGKIHSEESKQRMSQSKKGVPWSANRRAAHDRKIIANME